MSSHARPLALAALALALCPAADAQVGAAINPLSSNGAGEPAAQATPHVPKDVIAVLDIAHASQFSEAMMNETAADAAEWLVNEHLSKAAVQGVTLVILRNPYRWRPLPFETNIFGGVYPERRAALHAAIAAARAAGKPMPRLACYQTLPAGLSLSDAHRAILDSQVAPFDEDEWEAIGCKEWQQDMIDARRSLRPQYLEPVWANGFPRQWTYPIDVTEDFMSRPRTPFQLYPDPRPEIRCSMYRAAVPRPGESPRDAALRNARKFLAYCIPKQYTPVLPIDLYTQYYASASEIYIVKCAGDYDGSGFVNGDDLDEFLTEFLAGSRFCDMDGDGFSNGDDFEKFIGHWDSGC